MTSSPLDLAGVGIGPFNLSVAALLAPLTELNAQFFERNVALHWHPGLLLPGASLQTSYLKDLVTAVAPTSRYSFLAYLVSQRRFYSFLNADLPAVSRHEFGDYLAWVAAQLPNLHFGSAVREVRFDGRDFVLQFDDRTCTARNLCLATGKHAYVPPCSQPWLGDDCFHASSIALQPREFRDKRVVVVGGGQTGAEVVLAAMNGQWGPCAGIWWCSRRPTFEPLDETPFTNEYFMPDYLRLFYTLPAARKDSLVAQQKLASDGISPTTLRALYQALYQRHCGQPQPQPLHLWPHRELVSHQRHDGQHALVFRNGLTGDRETVLADIVVFSTGYQTCLPDCLQPLRDRLQLDGQQRYRLGPAFTVAWDGPRERRIYALNAGRHSHGIAEPQMSLMAWRSAAVINDLLQRPVYQLDQDSLLHWRAPAAANAGSALDQAC